MAPSAVCIHTAPRESDTYTLPPVVGSTLVTLVVMLSRAALAAADYDVSRRRLILHGGLRNEPSLHSLDELWEWDGESWSRRDQTLQAVRDHHYLVHDPSRATSVMFGGGGLPLGTSQWVWPRETWEWNGVKWSRLDVPGPSPRGRGAMIYDARRNEVMLFGGVSAPDSAGAQHYLNDTWRWNGTGWTKAADTGPAPRNAHAMAFDDGRGVALLYGARRDLAHSSTCGNGTATGGGRFPFRH